MVFADFTCNECGKTFIGSKKRAKDDFVDVKCMHCQSTNVTRMFTTINFQVAEGKLGNAKNGYNDNIVYKPASMTPKKHFDEY